MYHNPTTGKFKKRPLWQWLIIYLVPALIVYGLVYYGIPSMKRGAPEPQPATLSATPTVIFTDSGFSPSTLTIEKGTTVTFTNESSNDIRVASDPHPLHNAYPTKGGCVSSTFDSCAHIPPGSSWSFPFDSAGAWRYHNHLNFSDTGTIVVQ